MVSWASLQADLLAAELYAGDPDPVYAWLRAEAPVYRDEANALWGISRHRDIVDIETHPERWVNGPGYRPGTFADPSMLAHVKSGRPAPPDLSGFKRETVTDPYTGREFMYKSSGSEFTLYSVGENLQDDGGDTNGSFSSPDLSIERIAG